MPALLDEGGSRNGNLANDLPATRSLLCERLDLCDQYGLIAEAIVPLTMSEGHSQLNLF